MSVPQLEISVSDGFVRVASPKPGETDEEFNHYQQVTIFHRARDTAIRVGFAIGGVFGVRRGMPPNKGSLAERALQFFHEAIPHIRERMLAVAAFAMKNLPRLTAPRMTQLANFAFNPGNKLAIVSRAVQLGLKLAKKRAQGTVKKLTNEVVDHAGDKAREVAVGILDRAAVKIGVTAAIIGLVSGIAIGAGTGLASKILAAGAGAAGAGYLTNRVLKITGMKKQFIAGIASLTALTTGIAAFKLAEKAITMIVV